MPVGRSPPLHHRAGIFTEDVLDSSSSQQHENSKAAGSSSGLKSSHASSASDGAIGDAACAEIGDGDKNLGKDHDDTILQFNTAPESVISEEIVKSASGKSKETTTAGQKGIGRLSPEAYRLWGSGNSEGSHSDETKLCKGGPNLLVCSNPVGDDDQGVHCDKCNQWFHSSCQGVPVGAYRALNRFPILSWL